MSKGKSFIDQRASDSDFFSNTQKKKKKKKIEKRKSDSNLRVNDMDK